MFRTKKSMILAERMVVIGPMTILPNGYPVGTAAFSLLIITLQMQSNVADRKKKKIAAAGPK